MKQFWMSMGLLVVAVWALCFGSYGAGYTAAKQAAEEKYAALETDAAEFSQMRQLCRREGWHRNVLDTDPTEEYTALYLVLKSSEGLALAEYWCSPGDTGPVKDGAL